MIWIFIFYLYFCIWEQSRNLKFYSMVTYQIVIRFAWPGVPVADFCVGKLVEGRFVPCEGSVSELLEDCGISVEHVIVDTLLGTAAYLQFEHVCETIAYLTRHPRVTSPRCYGNMFVFEFKVYGHEKSQKEDKEAK